MNNSTNSTVSDIIAVVGGKDKFFDLRNALNVAYVEDYAMIHGCGGAKHASTSGIMLTITDYSGGTGDKSNFVHGIIPPYMIDRILSVCQQNAGQRVDGCKDIAAEINGLKGVVTMLYKGILSGTVKALTACSNLVKGTAHESGPFADFGQVFLASKKALTDTSSEIPSVHVRDGYTEFTYHQERVNTYRKDPNDGFVFVSVVDIARKQYNDKGDVRKYPWQIKIRNFYAPPKEQANGTTAYSASNARDSVECYIQISDDDMHRVCYAADHFIRVWENANAIPLVLQGLEIRKQARQNGNR